MADVVPFQGIRYDSERFSDLSDLICPPYDVISPQEQLSYHDRSPHNVIRVEFGLERPDDSPHDNRYTRAATTLQSWLRQGILIQEDRPALYLVEHRFAYQDSQKSRFSMVARVRLEDFGSGWVRPHEVTIGRAGEDRLRLMRACNANTSPIMALYRHRGEGVLPLFREARGRAVYQAVDRDGVGLSVSVVTDEGAIARVRDFFADKTFYIADGHHRYETALAFRREKRIGWSCKPEPVDYVMMTLTDADDPSLVMAPTHRVLRGLDDRRLPLLKHELDAYFDHEILPPSPDADATLEDWLATLEQRGERQTSFGLYGLDGRSLRLLTLRQKPAPLDEPGSLSSLDVYVLHRSIFHQLLGITTREMAEVCLDYTRDARGALAQVDSGECQLAFLLNPTLVSTMLAVADEGNRMPQKSTYFYPKTPTGLVMNPLWDD
ncbi:MAG: DUF1015 domain-containing protein [Chloroflexota bacterium]|nr:DUF1015 domain-containing protein [Chloroflexota bacterium]